MRNSINRTLDLVSFSIPYTTIEEALTADSSHIARSIYDVAGEKPTVLPIIITEDDRTFVIPRISQACVDIVTRLLAYVDDDTHCNDDSYTFCLRLPSTRNAALDSLILHELQRAIVAHVLAGWYEIRMPEMASRQWQLYEAAIAMLRHDIFMAHGKVRRAGSYY